MDNSSNSCATENWTTIMNNFDTCEQPSLDIDVFPFDHSHDQGGASFPGLLSSQVANLGACLESQPLAYSHDDHSSPFTHGVYLDPLPVESMVYTRESSAADANLALPLSHGHSMSTHYTSPQYNDLICSSPGWLSTLDNITTSAHLSPTNSTNNPNQHQRHDTGQNGHWSLPSTSAGRNSNYSPDSLATRSTVKCTQCNLTFSSVSTFSRHVRSEHVRPLLCIFHYAGCTSRFAFKNEWKRHVISQHLNLQYWVCTEGSCALKQRPIAESFIPTVPCQGSIFNRKDLYTQHIRRMHSTLEINAAYSDTRGPASGQSRDRIRGLQDKAARTRCSLPHFMLCPVSGCLAQFSGPNTWDDWMEHVSTHMQRAASGREAAVNCGGSNGWTLTEWAASEAVGITRQTSAGVWTLGKPIHDKGTKGGPAQRN
ncbi:hypothetical protein MY11210_006680 [Beauveria gryllotalpidicola]